MNTKGGITLNLNNNNYNMEFDFIDTYKHYTKIKFIWIILKSFWQVFPQEDRRLPV